MFSICALHCIYHCHVLSAGAVKVLNSHLQFLRHKQPLCQQLACFPAPCLLSFHGRRQGRCNSVSYSFASCWVRSVFLPCFLGQLPASSSETVRLWSVCVCGGGTETPLDGFRVSRSKASSSSTPKTLWVMSILLKSCRTSWGSP